MKVIAKLFSFLLIQSFVLFFSCTEKPSGPNISDELKPHGSITGYIYSLLDNQPVKDVLVSVNADSARAGISDATGKFTVGKVTAGTYTLRFIHRDYEDNPSYAITVEQGVDDTLSDAVWLSYAYYTLKGHVVFNTTPLPGAGVAVSGTPYSTLTDLNGSFLLTMIPCRLNTVKLICAKTGFGYGVDSSITCIPNDTTDVGSIYLISGGATVYGTVYDTSGNPISEVYVVAAIGGGLTDTTDMSGSYKLKNVPCNEKVTIYIPPTDKFYGSSVGFLLKEGTEAQIDIYLRPISDTTNVSKVSLYTDDMIVNESDITANLIVFPETGINTVIDTYYWNIGATTPKKQYITYDPECLVLVDTLKKYAGYFKGQKLETAVEVFAKTTDGYTSNSSYFTVMIHTNQPVVTAGASLHQDSTAKDAVTVEKNRGVWFKAKATDPFGGIDSITWNFGDGCTKVFSDTFPNFAYFYNSIDTFHAVVRAFDTDGNTASDTVVVRVIPPQITAPQLVSPADLDTVFINPGDSIPLTWHKKQEPNLTYTAYMEYKSTYPTEIAGTALQDTVLKVPVIIGKTYYWRVEAITATSDASSAVWCFTVAQKVVNNIAPQFDTSYTMSDSVEAGKIYIDTLRAQDADNDPMSFSLLNAPAAMILSNTVITWQTDTIDTGNHMVTARVRDSKGGADTLTWSIAVKPPIVVSAPVITLDPQPQTVAVGQTAIFGIIATGTKPFTYQWFRNDTLISGAADSSYTTPAVAMSDSGALYKCIVSNSAGSDTSAAAVLHVSITVIAPTITVDPQSIAVNEGQTATFGVIATGTKPFTYQWQRDSVNISGSIDSSYITPATTMSDNGSKFRCIVSNGGGSDTSDEATLTVNAIPPTITGDPQSITVDKGQTASFGVIASGTKPFTYKWQKDSTDISGATDSSYTTPPTTMNDSGTTYRCIVSNSAGADTSNPAILMVNDSGSDYTVTFIADSNGSISGDTVQYVAHGGSCTPVTAIPNAGCYFLRWTGDYTGTDNPLSITNVTSDMTITANFVYAAPKITIQPQPVGVIIGNTATFWIAATGEPTLTYQWQKNNSDISGATDSTYTISATTIGDSGTIYRCIVTNSYGSVPSSNALLTVHNPVTITWDKYPTYQEYLSVMYKFETDHPNLCDIVEIGESVLGRKLLFAKISDNVGTDEAEPEFMYLSSIHGNEICGYVLMLHLIDSLLSAYSTESRIKNLVDNIEIWICPLSNPDGTYKGGDNNIFGAVRNNANNVDLNRNFPYLEGTSPNPEKETQAIMSFIEQRNFVMSADFHSAIETVIYPWSSLSPRTADDTWFQYVAREYADEAQANGPAGYFDDLDNGICHGYSELGYIAKGTLHDYSLYFQGCRATSIEISLQKVLDESKLQDHWNYNYRSFLNYIEQVLYGIQGTVTDSITGNPIKSKVFVESHDVDSSWVYSNLPFGDYYRPIYEGIYNITFSAPGYMPKTISNVSVFNNNVTKLDVKLWSGR